MNKKNLANEAVKSEWSNSFWQDHGLQEMYNKSQNGATKLDRSEWYLGATNYILGLAQNLTQDNYKDFIQFLCEWYTEYFYQLMGWYFSDRDLEIEVYTYKDWAKNNIDFDFNLFKQKYLNNFISFLRNYKNSLVTRHLQIQQEQNKAKWLIDAILLHRSNTVQLNIWTKNTAIHKQTWDSEIDWSDLKQVTQIYSELDLVNYMIDFFSNNIDDNNYMDVLKYMHSYMGEDFTELTWRSRTKDVHYDEENINNFFQKGIEEGFSSYNRVLNPFKQEISAAKVAAAVPGYIAYLEFTKKHLLTALDGMREEWFELNEDVLAEYEDEYDVSDFNYDDTEYAWLSQELAYLQYTLQSQWEYEQVDAMLDFCTNCVDEENFESFLCALYDYWESYYIQLCTQNYMRNSHGLHKHNQDFTDIDSWKISIASLPWPEDFPMSYFEAVDKGLIDDFIAYLEDIQDEFEQEDDNLLEEDTNSDLTLSQKTEQFITLPFDDNSSIKDVIEYVLALESKIEFEDIKWNEIYSNYSPYHALISKSWIYVIDYLLTPETYHECMLFIGEYLGFYALENTEDIETNVVADDLENIELYKKSLLDVTYQEAREFLLECRELIGDNYKLQKKHRVDLPMQLEFLNKKDS